MERHAPEGVGGAGGFAGEWRAGRSMWLALSHSASFINEMMAILIGEVRAIESGARVFLEDV
jgi:hypothetical protein